MGMNWPDGGYSSEVEIYLLVDGKKVPVSHIGPDSIILRNKEFVRSGHAEIVIIVDGVPEVHSVFVSAVDSDLPELSYA